MKIKETVIISLFIILSFSSYASMKCIPAYDAMRINESDQFGLKDNVGSDDFYQKTVRFVDAESNLGLRLDASIPSDRNETIVFTIPQKKIKKIFINGNANDGVITYMLAKTNVLTGEYERIGDFINFSGLINETIEIDSANNKRGKFESWGVAIFLQGVDSGTPPELYSVCYK